MKGFVNPVRIKADSEGNAPQTIELLRTGTWSTPWHGDFTITREDLLEFVANADQGIGLVAADPKIPLNYGHAAYDKAAGWIPRLYVSDDGEALLGDPEWTPAATEAIKAKEWKYISPEFNPRSWPWEDPEEEHRFVNNVLTGAALTNIPLFKKLKPITASRLPGGVKASEEKPNDEGESMTIEEILAKAAADRTDEEKAFLNDHKAELTEDQLKQLTDEDEADDPAPASEEAPAEEEAAPEGGAPVEASALKGITEAELAQLRADAQAGREAKAELEKTKTEALVDRHISAGRIKSGERDKTVQMLLASKGEARTQLEAFIESLAPNALLANEQGHAGEPADEDVEITDDEKKLAAAFGNTEDELKSTKKAEAGK